MTKAIEVRDLCFSYPAYGRESRQLFTSLSLSVEQGSIHCVIGEPGSGKSTLAHMLAGLIPKYSGGIFTGEILLSGKAVSSIKRYDYITLLSLVMQDPDQQIITTSCEQEIAFPLESLGMEFLEMRKRVDESLEFFGLSRYRDRDPAELSGGEKKKLMLAAAYATDAPVLVLDESLEEIDPSFRMTWLKRVRERGKTLLYFASRNDAVMKHYADSWSVLHEGRIRTLSRGETLPNASIDIEPMKKPVREVLQARDLRFSYPSGFTLSIDALDIRSNEITALAGPNGCGKSTLCRLLCGLLKPSSGKIMVQRDGEWKVETERGLSRWAGYLFQNPDYQIFLPTIDDELMYGMKRRGDSLETRKRLAMEARETFSLPEGSVPPSIMSYGERKQLQAAVYYLLDKGLYLFDEMDSGLSFSVIQRILNAFTGKDASILLVTHHMEFAGRAAQRIITMNDGKIVSDIRTDRSTM